MPRTRELIIGVGGVESLNEEMLEVWRRGEREQVPEARSDSIYLDSQTAIGAALADPKSELWREIRRHERVYLDLTPA